MKRLPFSFLLDALLIAALFLPVVAPVESFAQRRVLGSTDDEDDEDDDDREEQKSKAKAKAKVEAEKKASEKARKKAAQKEAEAEAAEQAAEKAAEEAERKAEEAEKKAEEEAAAKEAAQKAAKEKKLKDSRNARLKQAKKVRNLLRDDDKVRSSISLTPGFVQKNTLVEFNFELSEKLAVAEARYGSLKPMNRLTLLATLKGEDGSASSHLVHATGRPGGYGFHFRPKTKGTYTLTLESVDDAKVPVSFEFSVNVGEWPPADFDEEESKIRNALSKGGGSGSRSLLGE